MNDFAWCLIVIGTGISSPMFLKICGIGRNICTQIWVLQIFLTKEAVQKEH